MKTLLKMGQGMLARLRGALAVGFVCLAAAMPAQAQVGEGVTFSKSGEQLDCNFIKYRINFYIDAWNADADSPQLRLLFKDVLPLGLSWVSNTVDTNLSKAGAAITEAPILTENNPGDLIGIDDMELPAVSQDIYFNVIGIAKIDRAILNDGDTVSNRALMQVSDAGPGSIQFPSHGAGLPDDGDPTTGDPFEIRLDLADCGDTPPPPPPPGTDGGDGPCFVIEEGEIECGKEFDGTYTYKMPVGPEMAGRTIELDVLTPGVWVAPPSQVVPAGGGVLEWTIFGATPGMTIELAVTGVDFTAGPKEGLGICCSQRIEITIPEGLPCDEIPDGNPHIDVDKKANTGECEKIVGGWSCPFTIAATNIGTAKHDGPMTIFEQVTNVSPVNNTVTTPPWVCVDTGGGKLRCEHPGLTLEPGEQTLIDVKVEFGDGFEPADRKVENCAWWAETDGDAEGPKSCDVATLCVPGEPGCDEPENPGGDPKQPKIEIEKKTDTPICERTEGGLSGTANCRWSITVTNTGDGDFAGPFTVFDEMTAPAPDALFFQPSPPWDCDWAPGTLVSKCFHPNLNLPAGAQTQITVHAAYDLAAAQQNGVESVTNCTGFSIGNDPRPETLDKCDSAQLPPPPPTPGGKADLQIDKVCEPGVSGAPVTCVIGVRNNGDALPTGPISVSDRSVDLAGGAAIQIDTVTPDGPEWMCSATPAETVFCSLPAAALQPGGVPRSFEVTLSLSSGQSYRNCARGTTRLGDVVTPFGEACHEGGTEIVIEKTGEATVTPGDETTFELTLSNLGTTDFNGDMMIADVMGIGGTGAPPAEIISIVPPLGCASEPTQLPFNCTATLNLAAGESRTHLVTVRIPEEMPTDERGFNCAAVLDPATGAGAGLGTAASGTALPQGQGPVSCHVFNLKEEQQSCQNGMVANAQGLCACPDGTRWNGRRCAGDPGKIPPPVVSCKLKPGQIRTSEGRCVCPQGTYLRAGRCEDIPPQECRLLPGQIRTESGRCICPEGTRLRNNRCEPYEVCTLKPGQIRDRYGRCVCPAGQVLLNGRCETPTQCRLLPGQFRLPNGECVCRQGLQEIIGQYGQVIGCRKPPELCVLKPGMMRINGECVCRRGLKPVYGRNKEITLCIPDQPVCRDKDRLRPDGSCCPRGTVHIGHGQCRKPPTACPDPKRTKPDGSCCPRGTHWGGNSSSTQTQIPRCVPDQTTCPDPKRRKYDGTCCPVGTVHAGHNVCRKVVDPVECTIKGQIKLRGQCVCPRGTKIVNGACQRPDPVSCNIKGQLFSRGRCVCPRGTEVINGACQRPQPEACKIKGQINSRGRCVCPKGTRVINGACQRPEPEACKIKGQINSRGRCVCPKGTRVIKGACQRPEPEACKIKGQINSRGRCVCPKGTSVIKGACQRPQKVSCNIKGQVVSRGRCVCPKGTKVISGACRRPGNSQTQPRKQQGLSKQQQQKLQQLLKQRRNQKQVN